MSESIPFTRTRKSLSPKLLLNTLTTFCQYFKPEYIKNIAQQLSGKQVGLFKEHGASDLRFTSAKNIPSIVFGPCGNNHHGKEEYVSIQNLELYYQALKEFVKKTIMNECH